MHIVQIFTPSHQFQNVIVLEKRAVERNKKITHKYLSVCFSKGAPVEKKGDKAAQLPEHMRIIQKANVKTKGIEANSGLGYEYFFIQPEDVVAVYKNEFKMPWVQIANNTLSNKHLRELANLYKQVLRDKDLAEIKPSKGKEIKQLLAQRNGLIDSIANHLCFKCERFASHLLDSMHLVDLRAELRKCQELLSTEANQKELEFAAKNKILQEYKMIDEDQNILQKGKVAKMVTSVDSILLTQLVFSGYLKKVNDEEMLALLSVMIFNISTNKTHSMLESEISPGFWEACMYMENETQKLINAEQQLGIADEQKDPLKRLNYFFYEPVYMWAQKKSFLEIKTKFPNIEEGKLLQLLLELKKLLRTVKDMSVVIGDISLGQRMDEAGKLLDREVMTT